MDADDLDRTAGSVDTARIGAGTEPDAEPDTEAGSLDGRRLRRARNRDAVVHALLGLYGEGNLDPSTEEIAARAGLSPRSLFRYFDDLDDLSQTAIDQAHRDVRHLLAIDASPEDPFARRADALAGQRTELFEAVESAALVTRLRAPFQLVVADRLARARSHLRGDLARLFAAELELLAPEVADRRLALADVATSFEGYRLLRDDQHLTRAEARLALSDSLHLLLAPGGKP